MIDYSDRIMMIDTETTNDIDDPIVYDVGYEVFDLNGNVYESGSLVNKDIFLDKDLMSIAYYADKIPLYWKQIWAKEREVMTWAKIKNRIFEVCKRNNCKIISAHNARFDNRSLNLTQRYITTSRWRYFLPYGTEWWCTLKMCREVFANDKHYKEWCFNNDFITANNQPQMTAEVVYRYLTNNPQFIESHTALEDVAIEKDIFIYCLRQNPEIDGRLWA